MATRTRSYSDALDALNSLQTPINSKPDPVSTRMPHMAAYLSRIGYSVADLDRLNIVHVAGTKGKGSTCAFVASILLQHFRGRQRAGGSSSVTPMHVGLFTSPHLVAVRERIRVDGIPLSEDDFARYFFEVWDRLDAWQPSTPPSVAATPSSVAASQASVVDTSSTVSTQTPPMATPTSVATNGETEVVDMEPPPGSKPTYARFLTLLSWHVYLSIASSTPSTSTSTVVASNHNHPLASNIVCVYETGIGGEYDSTNLPRRPLATGISSLGIDHVATLGATLPEIAWHKAGIMKAGSPAFTVQQPEEAMAVLRQRADELGGTSASVHLQVVDGDSGILSGVHIRPDASFQRKNAALAVALADAALKQLDPGYEGLPADGADGTSQLPRAFIDGLEQVKWRGRCEVKVDVARPNVVWHLDGAHTADSLRMAGRWFGEECARRESGNSGDVSTIRALVFNQQGRPEAATIFLERLFKAVKSKGPDGRRPFDVVVFCTNVTYATGYKKDFVNLRYDADEIEKLTVQRAFADKWRQLDASADVRVVPTIEESLAQVRELGTAGGHTEKKSVMAFVTGSLHLVGGALGVLEDSDAL